MIPTILMAAALPVFAARIAPNLAPEGGFADIVERTLPSVVRVVTASGPARGEGSGVILSRDGYLLTNSHVVQGATRITVQLADEREFPAEIVAADTPTDIAVLKVDAKGLESITFGDSGKVRIGDYALAIGNPFGVGTTVTLGIISAKNEGDYIQTDAAINPGNSGGPLLNTAGELIGINTAILSPSGGSNGVGFALPSNLARFIMSELITKGRVDRGYMGVGLQPIDQVLAEALGVRRGAAVIADVAPGSPAARAGLQKGDVVVAMNGRVMRDFVRMRLFVAQAQPGATVRMTIARQEAEQDVTVTLERKPQPVATTSLAGAEIADHAGELAVTSVEGPSADAGLRAGDVIVAAGRKPVAGIAALRQEMAGAAGKPLLLEVDRAGATFFIALPR